MSRETKLVIVVLNVSCLHPLLTDVCQCLPLDQYLLSNCPLRTETEIHLIPFCHIIHHSPVGDLKASLHIVRCKQDKVG